MLACCGGFLFWVLGSEVQGSGFERFQALVVQPNVYPKTVPLSSSFVLEAK
jgi:hypothetical protein